MKVLALVAMCVVGCVGFGAGKAKPDAEDLQSCEATFDMTVVKTCTVDADCALIGHDDCCGTTELGVAVTDRGAVEVAENHYEACAAIACGPRGCASQTKAEDGQVPSGNQTIVPACVMSLCTSVVR